KVGAEHVYKILVKQQIVNSITWVLTCALFIFVPLFWEKRVRRWVKEENDSEGGAMVLYGFTVVVPIMVGLIMTAVQMDSIVMGFVNPEYGAIKDIINFVKPK